MFIFFRKKKKLNLIRRPWKKTYVDNPVWVGVIRLTWDNNGVNTYSYVTLYESFKRGRYISYNIKDDAYSMTLTRHSVYQCYVVPWLNGMTISSDHLQTYNPVHKSIGVKQKPNLQLLNFEQINKKD